ncbi:MAG TPA: hypothetical protein VK524_32075, partial [Polyangiaceae bacterium]|nr:hypothetical protein [Polyangiaceae bacterium]
MSDQISHHTARSADSSRVGTWRRPLSRVALGIGALAGSACDENYILRVSDSADSGHGSLRAAITAANAASSSDHRRITIELTAGTYELSSCGSDDANEAGDLDIVSALPVSLIAVGGQATIRQTCAGERVLDARGGGALTLREITLTGGGLTGSDPAEIVSGGGLRATGDVNLERATITGNSAWGAAGLSAVAGGTVVNSGGARGGGLDVGGSLTATDSTISENAAVGGFGADAPDAEGWSAPGGPAEGGGAYVRASIQIVRGGVSDNRAYGGKAGSGQRFPSSGGTARGGGLAQAPDSTGTLSVDGAQLINNLAQGGGSGEGGVPTANNTIPGRADAAGGGIAAPGPVTLRGVNASKNTAYGGPSFGCIGCAGSIAHGGALHVASATISDSQFSQNRSEGGSRVVCWSSSTPPPPYTQCGPPPQPLVNYCPPYFCTSSCPDFCYYPPGTSTCPPITTVSCIPSPAESAYGGAIWATGDITLTATSSREDITVGGYAITTAGKVTIDGGEFANAQQGLIEASRADVRSARIHDNARRGGSWFTVEGHAELRDTEIYANGNAAMGFGDLLAYNVTIANNGVDFLN